MDSSDIPSGRSPRKEQQSRPKSPSVHKDPRKIKKPTLAPPQPSQPEADPLPPVVIGTEYLPKIMHISREKFKGLVQGLTGLPSSSSCSSTSSVVIGTEYLPKIMNTSREKFKGLDQGLTGLPSSSSCSSTSSVVIGTEYLPKIMNTSREKFKVLVQGLTGLPSSSSCSSTSSVAPSSNASDNNNSSAMSPAALYATTLPSSSSSSSSSVAPSSNQFDDKNSGLPDWDPLLGIEDWSEIAHEFDMMYSFPGMSSPGPANSHPPSPPSDPT